GDLVEEPRIDARGVAEALDGDAAPQRRFEMERTVGRSDRRSPDELVVVDVGEDLLTRVAVEAPPAVLERAQRLLQRLRKRATDRHRLADRLHAAAEHVGDAGELLERPARNLRDDVVDRRFEARWGLEGDVVGDLVERVADRKSRRDLGDRE